MKLVWKLLRQHVSIPQFTGFFLSNLIGLGIMLLGAQFYHDIQAVYESEDSFLREDYMILNKKIGTLNTITGKGNSFNTEELEEIKTQPFVEKMGVFTPSSFKVKAGFNIEGMFHFSTDLFFESVADDFVDLQNDGWDFHPEDTIVSIMIPKSYLDLYNFGFAQSQNMPSVSEGVLEALMIDLTIIGNGADAHYKGHIIGFSNRLNTILVPQTFMEYANGRFANDAQQSVSRVILQVDNPTDERITSFIQDNNYETDASKLEASKSNYMMKIMLTVVLIIGFVITLLAFFILMLSIYLLVEKNMSKLENLLLLGYSPNKVAFPYQLLTVVLNVMAMVIAILTVWLIRNLYLNLFENFFPDMIAPSMLTTWVLALILCVFISIFNYVAIRRKVLSIWSNKS